MADLQWVQGQPGDLPDWNGESMGVPMVIVDCNRTDRVELLRAFAGKGAYVVLLLDEKKAELELDGELGVSLEEGLLDDILLAPIRTVEVLSKIKHVAQLSKWANWAKWNDLHGVNKQLRGMIENLEEDVALARKIQRALIPEKFKTVPGFRVAHKYLSGFKSGGDYLDFFEFNDGTHLGVLMSDSTGYGLSSAFMALMFRLAARLTSDEEARSPSAMLAKIFNEVKVAMKPKESLSVFYGVFNRKTFDFTYASVGNVRFYIQKSTGEAILQNGLTDPLKTDVVWQTRDAHSEVDPGDRFLLLSDGFYEAFSSEPEMVGSISQSGTDSLALVNEFVFRIKNTLESPDDLPKQDCSIMVIDVEKRAMRLAR